VISGTPAQDSELAAWPHHFEDGFEPTEATQVKPVAVRVNSRLAVKMTPNGRG
jgi:hypothetical protein